MSEPGGFSISLFMVSDWRVGTGTGVHGYADRLVQRDDGGTASAPAAPIVPAKTLVGVWRDSCELAAHALDGGHSGVWHDWLGFLFGGRYATDDGVLRPAALALEGPLRLSGRLRELLRDKPRVAWSATFRKPGVAIDPVTGTAKTETLRFEEMARAGVTLKGRGRIEGFAELDQAQQDAAVALLYAGARLLETMGGKRRRGAGRCRMTVNGPGGAPDWTAPLNDVPPPPNTLPYAVADRPAPASGTARPGWEYAELVITVQQPVLVAATVLGNLVKSADHLPGWTLMPEVARRLGGGAHALVRTGDLVVTAATRQSPSGARTLPVPRILVHRKGEIAVSGNRMAGAEPFGKPFRSGYVVPEGAETHTIVTPGFSLRMHNSVKDDVQRPTRDIGGVYVYRALAAGTVLRAEVRVRAGLLEQGWGEKLAGRWRIGRSSKDDYGQVSVEARPRAARQGSVGSESLLRVWLLSDLLVRDLRLRPSTHVEDAGRALREALAKAGAVGVSLTPLTGLQEGKVNAAFGAHRTESWHRGWGLPRPTLYGLAAGSCLTFEVGGGPIAAAALAEVRAAGVGERRAEGFGQVELDHALLLTPVGGTPAAGIAQGEGAGRELTAQGEGAGCELLAPGETGYQEARVFECAAWRAEIHRACEQIKGDPNRLRQVIPAGVSASQLNALRQITRALPAGDAGSRLDRLTEKRAGRPDWPPEAIASVRGLLIDEPGRIWTLLALPEEELVVTGDGVTALRTELRDEAIRVLVDTCLPAHTRTEATEAPARATAASGSRA